MGQSKLELAVDTGKWDAGLKKGQQALNAFTQAQGGFQQALQKDNGYMQSFIQMMGKMDSTASTAKGQMNDYKRVLEQLTADYDKMTDAQKKSIGQDYLNAIDAMKQKFQQAKQQADALNRSLNEMGDNKLPDIGSGGSKLDGMLAVFGGNLMTKGASMAMSVVTDFASEINSCVKQGIELAKQGEGIRIAFERLGRGDILQGLREATHGTVTDLELMKAAVKFNDFRLPVEELGTMLAFAQQKAKDTGQSIDYMVDSIVTGLGRKSLMILDNLGLSAAEIKEKMAETGDMTKAVGEIIREQMAKAGDYVETAADRAAKANVDLQNKMEELGRKFAPVEEASNQLWTSMKIGILDIIGGPLARLLNDLTEAGRLKNALNDINGGDNGNETRVEKALRILREYSGGGKGLEGKKDIYNRQVAAYTEQETKAWREYNKTKSEQNAFINEVKNRGARESDADKLFEFERRLEKVKNEALAWQKIKAEYQQGAKEILKPISPKIDTSKLEQSVDALKIKLAELEAQRKKAIASGDTELSKNLLKQINQVKTDIRGLDPNALKTTHTQTKQDKAAEMVATAERVYAETIAKADMELKAGLTTDADVKKKTLAAQEQLYSAYGNAYATYADPKYKEAQDKAAAEIVKLGGEVKTSVDAQKKVQEAARELERAQKKLADAQAKLDEAQKTGDLKQVYAAQKAVTNAQKEVTTAQTNVERVKREITEVVNVEPGKVELPDVPKAVTVPITYTSGNLDAFISNLKEQISQADIGSELHNRLTAQLADATTLGTLMQTAIQNGIDTAQFNPQDLWKKVFGDTPGDYIDDQTWQSIVDKINEKRKEQKLDPIKINFETGNVANDGKEVAKDWNNAASAISAVGSAMSSIEDPAAKVMGTIAQAIATIALTYAKSLEGTFTPWDWIAGAAAGLAQMTAVVSAIHSSTGYAEGGIIQGNSFSGDNIIGQVNGGGIVGLNSGELVLNRSEQGILSSALQGNAMKDISIRGALRGEDIVLVADRWGRRTGKGELAFWK